MSRRPLCLAALLFVCWIVIMKAAGMYPKISLPPSLEGNVIRVRGEVYRQEKKNSNLIYLKNNSILSETNSKFYESNILVYTKAETDYKIGNIVKVTGICKAPESASNPGQFDMAAWYQSEGIDMFLMKAQVELEDPGENYVRQKITEVRNRPVQSFYGIAQEKDASVMSAMLLGEKNGLDESVKELYQISGISHILSISGLHISMLGMALFKGVRKIGVPFVWAVLICAVVMGLYSVMTGFGVSTLRSFLMFLVYLGAQLTGRTYDLKNALALAVIVTLLQNPLWLFQGGFQLSFLAVAGLAFLYPAIKKKFRIKNKIIDSFLVSLSVQLIIFPCILYHFFEFPVAGIFLNLLIIPFSTALLLNGLIGCVAGVFFIPAGILCFSPCHYILLLYEKLCQLSIQIPGTLQIWGRPEVVSILCYYGSLLLFYWLLMRKKSSYRWLIMAGFLMVPVTLGLGFHRTKGMELTFLDVGQGDCIFPHHRKRCDVFV